MAYDIFPPPIFRHRACPPGSLSPGTTIVQRVGVVVALEFAVRVVDVWDTVEGDHRSAGFTYVTLRGHAECGVETFEVRKSGDSLSVLVTATSLPATWITRLLRRIARRVQIALTRRALIRLASPGHVANERRQYAPP